jgi:hypothetical protein
MSIIPFPFIFLFPYFIFSYFLFFFPFPFFLLIFFFYLSFSLPYLYRKPDLQAFIHSHPPGRNNSHTHAHPRGSSSDTVAVPTSSLLCCAPSPSTKPTPAVHNCHPNLEPPKQRAVAVLLSSTLLFDAGNKELQIDRPPLLRLPLRRRWASRR